MGYTTNDIARTRYRGEDAIYADPVTSGVKTLAVSFSVAGTVAAGCAILLSLGIGLAAYGTFDSAPVVSIPVAASYVATASVLAAIETGTPISVDYGASSVMTVAPVVAHPLGVTYTAAATMAVDSSAAHPIAATYTTAGTVAVDSSVAHPIAATYTAAATMVVAASTGPSSLVYDTFTDTNGTNLTAHTMNVGTGWTAARGSISVQSNKARCTNIEETVYHTEAGVSDFTITSTINLGSTNYGIGHVVRLTDVSNYWFTYAVVSGWRLYEVNSGVFIERQSEGTTIAQNTDYTISVECDGNTITAIADGVTFTHTTATFNNTATKIGIYADFANSGQTIDTFEAVA